MPVCTPSQTLGRSPAVSWGPVRKRFRHCVEVHELIKVARQTLLGDIFGRLTREESLLHSYLGGTPDACSFRVVQLEAFAVGGVRHNRPPHLFGVVSNSRPIRRLRGAYFAKSQRQTHGHGPLQQQAYKRPRLQQTLARRRQPTSMWASGTTSKWLGRGESALACS